MSEFAVILPAAGKSSRFQGFHRKKPFVELNGRAVWLRTVDHFVNRSDVAEVVLVLATEDIDEFRERFGANLAMMNIRLCEGGASRAESVRNGLKALRSDAAYVAVHDAARPLIAEPWITEVFTAARTHGAAIPGLSVSSTVKQLHSDRTIARTVDRTNLVLAQTPQVFRRSLLLDAYSAAVDPELFTDEASLIEAHGGSVYVCEGWPINIKITTADDFRMAESLLNILPAGAGLERPGLMDL